MSFIGPTDERLVETAGRTFKIFITEQVGGYWVATLLYSRNGTVDTKNMADTDKAEAFRLISEWILNNIDSNAVINPL
ncbi:hypothetical protein [Arhodomonas aquaeolei]|uniref:hypothetical protein n=1 Tax=Arhodomonas aquaeolei TaxID=2369 RepID=UPI0012EC1D90|nr:hypothetical protein [Arhodomonas aquaeolei]